MTGYRSSNFRHECARDGCYNESLPCWDDLIAAFPRRIRPTDVDGLVEINGHALFLEQKGPGVPLPEGQRRALRSLSRREAISTVFFRPPISAASDLECLFFGSEREMDGWQPFSRGALLEWLGDWAAKADANPYSPFGLEDDAA